MFVILLHRSWRSVTPIATISLFQWNKPVYDIHKYYHWTVSGCFLIKWRWGYEDCSLYINTSHVWCIGLRLWRKRASYMSSYMYLSLCFWVHAFLLVYVGDGPYTQTGNYVYEEQLCLCPYAYVMWLASGAAASHQDTPVARRPESIPGFWHGVSQLMASTCCHPPHPNCLTGHFIIQSIRLMMQYKKRETTLLLLDSNVTGGGIVSSFMVLESYLTRRSVSFHSYIHWKKMVIKTILTHAGGIR